MQLDVEFQATDLDQSRKHTRWVGRPGYPELLRTRLVKRTVCKYQEFPHLVYYRKSGVVAWRERKKEPGAENYLRMIPHKSVFQNSQPTAVNPCAPALQRCQRCQQRHTHTNRHPAHPQSSGAWAVIAWHIVCISSIRFQPPRSSGGWWGWWWWWGWVLSDPPVLRLSPPPLSQRSMSVTLLGLHC